MSGRIEGMGARATVEFTFDGATIRACAGDTVAMALWAAGEHVLRRSSRDGSGRSLWCNMGICYECLVVVDGATVRACAIVVRPGMHVERGGRP